MRLPFLAVSFAICMPVFAADSAPGWVMEQASHKVTAYEPDVRSVVLMDDGRVEVDPDATLHRTLRHAVRVLTTEGRQDTVAAVAYFKKSTKIKEFRAWLVDPSGTVKAYGKESISDVGVKEEFELYDETRERVIVARNAAPGSTFVWTATLDESPMLLQDEWYFQHHEPVLSSRYTLALPAGWTAQGTVFGASPLQPAVDGTTYTWEARDLPFIKHEPASPSPQAVAPWLGVSFYPVSGGAAAKVVKSWTDLSVWQCRLADAQANSNDELTAKVRQLTGSAATPYAKMQAIAGFVQKIRYVAIQTNIANGGGYQPHLATDVFAKQYGDCKDKANLMRAMLKVAGIDSYLISLYSGDRNYVHPEWAAPGQFNHMIIAIKVPDDVKQPAVLVHPTLGRLLIFDPTDDMLPIGDLPENEQGSYALIMAGGQGNLTKMPVAPEEANRLSVAIAATLTDTGALEATIDLTGHGQSASMFRGWYTYADPSRLQGHLERWVAATARLSTLSDVRPKDEFDADQFGLHLNVTSPAYAQVMQRRMIVFRPAVLARAGSFEAQTEARTLPVVLQSECYHKQVNVTLPAGFAVDELPNGLQFSTAFGKFSSSYKVDGANLVFTEDLDVTPSVLPATDYAEVKTFFQHVAGAEQAPLLLVKN